MSSRQPSRRPAAHASSRGRLAWSQPAAVAGLAALLALATLAEPGPSADAVAASDSSPSRAGALAERVAAGTVVLPDPAAGMALDVGAVAAWRGEPTTDATPDDAPDDAPDDGRLDPSLPPPQSILVVAGGRERRLGFVDLSPPVVNGRTALLLHGERAAADGRWARAATRLAAEGYRVVVPDLAGYAPGELPPPSADDLAAHAAFLLDALGVPEATVVAHGPGGDVALRLAAREPRVSGLALVAAATPSDAAAELPTLLLPEGALGALGADGAATLDRRLLDFLAR